MSGRISTPREISEFVGKVSRTKIEKQKKEQLEEENRIIFSISKPDYKFQANKSSITPEAATAISLDWDPQEIKKRNIKLNEFYGPVGERYRERLELIKNAIILERFGKVYTIKFGPALWEIFPRQFVEWLERMEISVPDE